MHGLHQGYSYQDLLTALLIAENLHFKDFKIGVEVKENSNDSFDDIVIIANGKKAKFQIKHTSVNNPLTEDDFTNPSGNLNIDKLAKSYSSKKDVRFVIATNRTLKVAPIVEAINNLSDTDKKRILSKKFADLNLREEYKNMRSDLQTFRSRINGQSESAFNKLSKERVSAQVTEALKNKI